MANWKNKDYLDFLEKTWTTHTGKGIKIKDLSDSHLANIIDFIKSHNTKFVKNLIRISEIRGLSEKFLMRAQIPYKNENDKWEIYTNEIGFEEISK